MDWLELDQDMCEIVPRGESHTPTLTPKNLPTHQSSFGSDDATAAMDMVSQAAAAIKELEQRSAEAVARAHNAAYAVIEKLELADARAARAEAAQSKAESQVTELTAAAAVLRKDLEMLQTQLAAKEAELAAAERRARIAQRGADDAERKADGANAAIERIVDAIRAQLPVKSEVTPIQTNLI